MAEDLLQDPKETAEHIILVDLGQNDLRKICSSGNIIVNERMVV
ncbi:hypothetical protein RINTHM_120 [Richelia intracellularis HM01]|nr:hypothetical protein RINTHM_120 [Richelia intracellularis HM01]